MVCLNRRYQFKFFKNCLPRLLLGPLWKNLAKMINFSPRNFKKHLLKFNKLGSKLTVSFLTEWFLLVDCIVLGVAPFSVNKKEKDALAK